MPQLVLHGIIFGGLWGVCATLLILVIDTAAILIIKLKKIPNMKPSLRFLEGIAAGIIAYFTIGLLKSPTASAIAILTAATIYATLTPKLLKLVIRKDPQ